MPINKVRLLRDAANVKRFHTARMIRSQSNGEHSFGMLLLLYQVHPDPSPTLIKRVMHHDLPELLTGDVPGPTKRANPRFAAEVLRVEGTNPDLYFDPRLPSYETALVRWLDRMELVLWCAEDANMGNAYAHTMARDTLCEVMNNMDTPMVHAKFPVCADIVDACIEWVGDQP